MSLGFHASICRIAAKFTPYRDECLPERPLFCQAPVQRGFTLMELLVVIVLMGIIATVASALFLDNEDEIKRDIAKYEMSEIRKALVQFRHDVGHFPGLDEGGGSEVFADDTCFEDRDGDSPDECESDRPYRLRLLWACAAPSGEGESEEEEESVPPYEEDSHCKEYNPDIKRGWNGPYIQPKRQLTNDRLLDPWGYPYVLLAPDDDKRGLGNARLVSAGPDMEFQSLTEPEKETACNSEGDDLVLCLVR
jgi:prepilin-type N-terminal cleavage/methylation domain-containing protein